MEHMPLISTSPQIHQHGSTRRLMIWVLVAMAPAALWGVYLFGGRVALILLASTASAVLSEAILNLLFKRNNTLGDLSAVVTGVLVGFNMPPGIPLFIPITASFFAIAVVKWSFGGLGANWMNPAMAGRVFVFFSWGRSMSRFTLPGTGGVDTVTGPTPLGSVKTALSTLSDGINGPMQLLDSEGLSTTYSRLFVGHMPGSVGEMSAMLIIAGGLLLVFVKVINWEIPVSFLGSFGLLMWAFDGLHYGGAMFTGDLLFQLLTGGIMLGAWFMATDLVTSPLTFKGRVIYGVGCGFITFVIRSFGNLPEGVSLAIIFMNILVPLVDRFCRPTRYGVIS